MHGPAIQRNEHVFCKRLWSPGIDSASQCSLAGRYDKLGCRTKGLQIQTQNVYCVRERKEVGHWRRWGNKTTSKKQRPLPVRTVYYTIALRGKVMRAPEINGREENWNSKLDFGRGMFIEGGAVRTF